MSRVSFAVMAHPSRSRWVTELLAQLPPETPVAWAEPPWATRSDHGACWRTKRAALQLHSDAPFHCVIQDDALLAQNFVHRVEQLVEHGDYVYMLFYRHKHGWQDSMREARRAEVSGRGYFITSYTAMLGVATVIPTAWIDDLVEYGDGRDPTLGDDNRLKTWVRHSGREILVPIPSLVDHRVGPSLVGHPDKRVAWRFAS